MGQWQIINVTAIRKINIFSPTGISVHIVHLLSTYIKYTIHKTWTVNSVSAHTSLVQKRDNGQDVNNSTTQQGILGRTQIYFFLAEINFLHFINRYNTNQHKNMVWVYTGTFYIRYSEDNTTFITGIPM